MQTGKAKLTWGGVTIVADCTFLDAHLTEIVHEITFFGYITDDFFAKYGYELKWI